MKKWDDFNKAESIPIMEFLLPFTETRFFIEEGCEKEYKKYPNNFISDNIIDEDGFEQIVEGEKNFPYNHIKSWEEKGDGHDEETRFCVLERKSDGKLFKIWIHDDGSIGPSCLTLCESAVEVQKKTKNIVVFKDR